MSLLAIDAGNTRIKWGLWEAGAWASRGSVLTAQAGELRAAWNPLAVSRAVVSNVAGEAVRRAIEDVLGRNGVEVDWVVPGADAGGVRNGYVQPAQLGPDRWSALLGARQRCRGACLVVNAGTAVTIDALSERGEFLGGLILPGLQLMVQALASRAARLTGEQGEFVPFPRSSADAMASGGIQAICGAIERQQRTLAAAQPGGVQILLSGGAAQALRPHLSPDVMLVPDLVLEGLLVLAGERAAP